ncbi:MAG: ABC transporter ATP-binding protein [Armatimonadota bacterium]|nr:MAG: ABC transporter ATP-binding protein [Armatimonadota bacterium]
MSLVDLQDVTKIYRAGSVDVPALRGVDLNVEPGEFVAIMGRSGSGKTTMLNVLGCVDRPTHGRYLLAGEDVRRLNDGQLSALRLRRIGFVFQTYNLLPGMSALDNVMLPTIYSGRPRAAEAAREVLVRVGLAGREHHRPAQLSGGEQQRVAIARSLINGPSLILADEPTGNLDTRIGEEVLGLFQDLNRDGITILLVTHEEQIAEHARRIVRLRDGRIESDMPVPQPLDARAVLAQMPLEAEPTS